MLQYPIQPNVELYVKKRKEAHKVLRQEKRKRLKNWKVIDTTLKNSLGSVKL